MTDTQGRPRWQKILIGIALAIVFVGLFTVTAAYTFLSGLGPGVADEETLGAMEIPEPEPDSRIHILVLGLDDPLGDGATQNPTRSDTMILATFDPLTREGNLVFIPRDTRVHIPERPTMEKINHAHAYGGVGRAIETVKDFLDVPVHYYVRIDFQAFVEIIDVIGGVEMEVERRMTYEDPTQDLYIDIPAGTHQMDGETALKYVRYRNGSDIDRIGRQKQFLERLLAELFSVANVIRIPALAERISANVDTNMQPSRMVSLARAASGMSQEDFDMHMIPGTADYIGGVSYWLHDDAATRELVEREILGISHSGDHSIKVAVLNGGGIEGAADTLAGRISELGYEVIHVGDAPDMGADRYDESRVTSYIDGNADKVLVRTLKILMGDDASVSLYREGGNDHDEESSGESPSEDLRVYVGADFEGLVR